LPVGTPLYICHVSQDARWLLVESPATAGWLPARDVARVDEGFQEAWQAAPLAALVRDNVELGRARGDIGTLLPLAGAAPSGLGHSLSVYLPAPGPEGQAVMTPRLLEPDAAARIPLRLTPRQVAVVGNRMMGQAYGWGGLDGKRDCSALTRDLLAPFGLYLPRNSASQARLGRGVPLSNLPGAEKERRIVAEGVPFRTLLWLPGHIGLYIGQYEGRAMMFHNMWGLRIRDDDGGCTGRAVVGKAVVTSLRAGVERPDLCAPGGFLDSLKQASVLP
jgi:hypothetical protein